jgi:YesN/AraC family two-component response regulator
VLIIDDDPTLLDALKDALQGEFHVLSASDAPTAETLLAQHSIDLIVLDVVPRDGNGLDFLTKLRHQSDVPVLVISACSSKEVVLAAMRARANDYLDKPLTLSQLCAKIRELTAAGHRPDHVAERIREFIEQQYMRDWSVEELANALHLSVRTMRRAFRQKYRRRVTDFLEETRLRRAQQLLATTDLPIKQVSFQVGFKDRHYFTRVFHQRIGKSPRGFRTDERRDLILQGASPETASAPTSRAIPLQGASAQA